MLGELPLIAEDLGVITPRGRRGCASRSGCPGMAVLQFGFTPSERHTPHVPEQPRENQVVYTGTHDNDTVRGWYESLPAEVRAMVDARSTATTSASESPTGR